jgi:hypothetical protein
MPRRMEQTRDLTDKKVTKTVQESRKQSFTEIQHRIRGNSSERQHRGNMPETAQMSTPSSRESVYRDRRFDLRQERWQEKRRSGGVMSQSRPKMRESDMKCKVNLSRFPSLALELKALRISGQSSESPRHWRKWQGNEVKSRPNERKSNTSALGKLKGGGGGEPSKKPDEDTSKQQEGPKWTLGVGGGPVQALESPHSDAPESNTAGYQNPSSDIESLPSGYIIGWEVKPKIKGPSRLSKEG